MTNVWTSAAVKMLFTSSGHWAARGSEEEYVWFADLLNTGQVLYEQISYTIPTPQPDQQVIYHMAFRGNSSPEHGQVKWAAWCWAQSLGEKEPRYEVRGSHGVADVIAPTLKYLIECGDTAPRKVTQALTTGWNAFALFTFPYVDIKAWRAAGNPEDLDPFRVHEAVVFRSNPAIPLQEANPFWENAAGMIGL